MERNSAAGWTIFQVSSKPDLNEIRDSELILEWENIWEDVGMGWMYFFMSEKYESGGARGEMGWMFLSKIYV